MKTVHYTIAILMSAFLTALVWAYIAYPRHVENTFDGPLKSASFAPFRDGQSPLTQQFPSAQEIEDDLILLKGIFSGVRTYTSQNGMEMLPELAKKHGFNLTHSAWIGRDQEENSKEVDALIKAANDYPHAVTRVLVGNEVLLRNELSPDELIAHIDRVQAAVDQPVSYADVWAFWLKHPQIADHVDFITIHILPYWEDEPVSVEEAHHHFIQTLNIVKARFPGKPILVGETGWPTEGRSRGPATANVLNAAEFIRAMPKLAEQHQFDYNIVEAFDQTWKARNEGTVGARWGLFDADRQLKFTFAGDVVPYPNKLHYVYLSFIFGLAITFLLKRHIQTVKQTVFTSVFAQLIALSFIYSIESALTLKISPSSFTWIQQHYLFYAAAKGWINDDTIKTVYELLLLDWVSIQANLWSKVLVIFSSVFCIAMLCFVRADRTNTSSKHHSAIKMAYSIYAISAIIFCWMFATSGRYMDMATPHFLLPLTFFLYLTLSHRLGTSQATMNIIHTERSVFNSLARWLLPFCGLYCIWGEASAMLNGQDFTLMHPTLSLQIPFIASSIMRNEELLIWALVCIAFAYVFRINTINNRA